jgi:dimethylamine corrinoid protein
MMGKSTDEILQSLQDGVVNMDKSAVVLACQDALSAGITPAVAVIDGLMKGMQIVSQKYENEEYYIPEILLSSDVLDAGLKFFNLYQETQTDASSADVVIGVMEGDVHDLGKNMVKLMMQSRGISVYDLGKNVSPVTFVEKAQAVGAKLICLSTMMASTMDKMKQVTQILAAKGLRNHYVVLIGGAPISQSFADSIGADGYYPNAAVAAKKTEQLLKRP